MLLDRVSNPGPLTYESGALPIALRGRMLLSKTYCFFFSYLFFSFVLRGPLTSRL